MSRRKSASETEDANASENDDTRAAGGTARGSMERTEGGMISETWRDCASGATGSPAHKPLWSPRRTKAGLPSSRLPPIL
jgi:hypothetical protein